MTTTLHRRTTKSFNTPTVVSLLSVCVVAELNKKFHGVVVLVTRLPQNPTLLPQGFSALENLHAIVIVLLVVIVVAARLPLLHEIHPAVVPLQTPRSEDPATNTASRRHLLKANQLHVLCRVVESAVRAGPHPVAAELQRKHGAGCVLQACGALRSPASVLEATALPFSNRSWGRAGPFFVLVVHSEDLGGQLVS